MGLAKATTVNPDPRIAAAVSTPVPTAGPTPAIEVTYWPDVGSGEYPLVLVQNEGIIIENRVALGVAAGSAVSIDVDFSFLTAY